MCELSGKKRIIQLSILRDLLSHTNHAAQYRKVVSIICQEKNWKESSCLPSIQTPWVLRDFFLLLIILHSYTHMNAHTYIHNHQYSQINYGKAKLSYFNIPDHNLLKISFIRLKQQQQQNYVIKSLWSLDSLLFYL